MRLLEKLLGPDLPAIPELDEVGLRAAFKHYFQDGSGVPDDKLAEQSAEFYAGLDLDRRGDIWRDGDIRTLWRVIPSAVQSVVQARGRVSRPLSMLVIGCGDGRLTEEITTNALLAGIGELGLNDLHPFHVEAARAKIEAMRLGRSRLRVRTLPGDITAVAGETTCDVALAQFFVDAEVLSIASVRALQAKRREFHTAVADCLGPGGVLIMDRPDASTGFYAEVRRMTQRILEEHGVMPGEEGNLDLAWIPGGAQPYHIRYVPERAAHHRAMREAGFELLDDRVQVAEPTGPITLKRQKVVELWQVTPRGAAAERLPAPRLLEAGYAVTAA